MATLNIVGNPPGDQAGVTIATKLDGYTIRWAAQELGELVQVWQNTTNNRNTATLVATVADTYYDSPTLLVGVTYFVWTRRLSQFGVPGNWDLGVSAGRSATVVGVTPANQKIATFASTTVSSTAVGGSTVPSTYNVWVNTGNYFEFTAPTGSAIVAGEVGYVCLVSNVVHTGLVSGGRLIGRLQLWNQTDSIELPHLNIYHTFAVMQGLGGSPIVNEKSPIFSAKISVRSGFGDGAIIPGKVYRYRLFLQKNRLTSDITFDVSFNASYSATGTQDSVSVS